jgi:hypothetical protein
MNVFLIVSIVFAVLSGPLTKFLATTTDDWEDSPWWTKAVMAPLALGFVGYMYFPIWAAARWAESFQDKSSPDSYLAMKGVFLALAWMVIACQWFFRLGYKIANEKHTKGK